MSTKIRHAFGILIILIAIIMLIWGKFQFPRQTKTVRITAANFLLSTSSASEPIIPDDQNSQNTPAMNISAGENLEDCQGSSAYIMTLDAPTRIRTGDADYIRLKIQPDKSISAPTNTQDASEDQYLASPPISGTYNLLAETRLELDGILFKPTGDVVAPFQPEQPLSLFWTIQPENPGITQGILWLHFQYVAKDGNSSMRKMVSRQSFEIESVSFAGLRGDIARFAGGIGLIIGLVLDIDLWIALFNKIKDKQRK